MSKKHQSFDFNRAIDAVQSVQRQPRVYSGRLDVSVQPSTPHKGNCACRACKSDRYFNPVPKNTVVTYQNRDRITYMNSRIDASVTIAALERHRNKT